LTDRASAAAPARDDLDLAIQELDQAKDRWAQTDVAQRLSILAEIKDNLMTVARDWAETAARHKQIPDGSPLVGEEWISGPYAVMATCNALIDTLSHIDAKAYLRRLPSRTLANGQLAVDVVPASIWDRLLLSGVRAEVWMQPGVSRDTLTRHAATAYDDPPAQRRGKVALVLGAGNIAAIAPLDVFHKLFSENQVVILKLNPVNDYLSEFIEAAFRPLIAQGALRLVKGGADVGSYLCTHPDVAEIHITGAQVSHDAIVWGAGAAGARNRQAGTPVNARRITSELGAVCPTIVVPGPWRAADLRFQAENIATQKLHNSGFNCIACQVLILPDGWQHRQTLLDNIQTVMRNCDPRGAYYPGAEQRMAKFAAHADQATQFDRGTAPACIVAPQGDGKDDADWLNQTEVFAPAMTTLDVAAPDPATYLRAAVRLANDELHGTLGANIVIHPATIRQIGRAQFEAILGDLRYGCIGVNAWTGVGFLLPQVPWGAFPGHTLQDVQSGIGFVHNSRMFSRPERTIVTAPFRPFPRSLTGGGWSLLPRPPWFVTNRKQHVIGALLTAFEHRPGWSKLPRIFLNALLG
jgi:acyl-CoA reductase-like NAD-dependent aldehyde dehydrogenase